MRRDHETYTFACHRKFEGPNAVLLLDHATGEEIWIPLSQVDEMHFDPDGNGEVVMTAWIAKKKGLI